MLELDKLIVRREDFDLLADVSFGGAITGLIGPSGGGKSTLLNTIAGFITPQSGRILLDGRDITTDAPQDRPTGILFQDNNLFPHLTVRANLGLALHPGRLTRADIGKVDAALEEVGLGGVGLRKPGALSGGQLGRAALARVMLQDRPLILLDESFGALGPALRAEMLELIATMARRKGRQVLMVSHAPEDVKRIADNTAIVSGGQVHAPRPTDAFFAHPTPAARAYLGG